VPDYFSVLTGLALAVPALRDESLPLGMVHKSWCVQLVDVVDRLPVRYRLGSQITLL